MVNHTRISAETTWYDLFSRGARDWLRHNEKVREGVQQSLPDLIAGSDIITGSQDRMVRVPVRMLEHARFRLSDAQSSYHTDAGQGQGNAGDVLRPMLPDSNDDEGQGDNGEGEVKLLLELKVDDIMDWLWEELKLPDIQPKRRTAVEDQDYVREGWDKHGARARLDRRRTVKEAVKRRAIQENPVPFSNEALRFKQLVRRRKPATNAVVIFALDVSASMTEAERKLAKIFFFSYCKASVASMPRSKRVLSRTPPRHGNFRKRISSKSAALAVPVHPRHSASPWTLSRASMTPHNTTVICSMPLTVRTSPRTGSRQRKNSRS